MAGSKGARDHIMAESQDGSVARATCIVCMDTTEDSPWIALSCGHIYHMLCWQQTKECMPQNKPQCPTCKKVQKKDVDGLRLYNLENIPVKTLIHDLGVVTASQASPAVRGGAAGADNGPSTRELQIEAKSLKSRLRISEDACKEWRSKAEGLEEELQMAVEQQQKLTKKVQKLQGDVHNNMFEIDKLNNTINDRAAEASRLRGELASLREKKDERIRQLEDKIKHEERAKANLQREVEHAQSKVRQQERTHLMHKMSLQPLSEVEQRRLLGLDGVPGMADLDMAVKSVQIRDQQLAELRAMLEAERAARREECERAALHDSTEARKHAEVVARLAAERDVHRRKALQMESDIMLLREQLQEAKQQQRQQQQQQHAPRHTTAANVSDPATQPRHTASPGPELHSAPSSALPLSLSPQPSPSRDQAQRGGSWQLSGDVSSLAGQAEPWTTLDEDGNGLNVVELDGDKEGVADKENRQQTLDVIDVDLDDDLFAPRLPGSLGLMATSNRLIAQPTSRGAQLAGRDVAGVRQVATTTTQGVKRAGPQQDLDNGLTKRQHPQGPVQDTTRAMTGGFLSRGGGGVFAAQRSSFLGKEGESTSHMHPGINTVPTSSRSATPITTMTTMTTNLTSITQGGGLMRGGMMQGGGKKGGVRGGMTGSGQMKINGFLAKAKV